ncbi:MAG: hypothetical protein JNM66_04665, partial [Bryobacterales bacterium]|nr:hypothetical protein [Bryobacterales bacterium]
RQYNPGYGRFVTPDENLADQDVGDPLSWNLYAYARNNPLRYSDPTGRVCVHNSDGSIVDDGAGTACDFSQFMTARAKRVEVAAATDQLGEDWGFRVLAEVGRLSSDGSVVEEGMKAARDWRQLLRNNPIPLLMGVVANSHIGTGQLTIRPDKHGKHVRGHRNFQEGKGEFTHSDPQGLLDRFAGKGRRINDQKEAVDFGETIGTWVGPQGQRLPTTRGIIDRDSRGGAHIVPANPVGN